MKKTLINSIVGITAVFSFAVPSYGQGKINLDNYDSTLNPLITYGASWGPSLSGQGMQNNTAGGGQWTIGFYYTLGDVTGSIANDPTGFADPSTLGGGLAFANGSVGDTTTFNAVPGKFTTTGDAVINGYTSGVITMELVVYNSSSYSTAFIARGHSPAFTLTPATGTATAPQVGNFMPAFSIQIMPEPSTFALAGIGSTLFLAFRRRQRS